MKIKRLVIENFKSIERIELIEPNPFTVFVGPNGSGKSNIFDALEFVNWQAKNDGSTTARLFGGRDKILHRKKLKESFHFKLEFNSEAPNQSSINIYFQEDGLSRHMSGIPRERDIDNSFESGNWENYRQFYNSFGRLFLSNNKTPKLDFQDEKSLNTSASNLEKVLKRILKDESLRDEIFEWFELFVPGFKTVEVDDRDELHWFEQSAPGYFTKDLISDGTYNILALLTAVYQSDKPQFLCIEEPENGLHPDVVKEFVNLCRYACETSGHFIWLNTHSQTLASQLTADEIVVVNKVEGATQTKQFKGRDFHGLRMDEAWLMNVLGGGLPF